MTELSKMDIVLKLITLVGFVLLMYALYKYCYWRYKLRKLAGPTPLPLIGNAHQLGTKNEEFFKALTKLAEENRDAGHFVLYIGLTPIVFVCNAKDMETLLCDTRLDTKAAIYYFVKDWLNDGLLMSKGPKWTARRKLMSPSFHFSILSKFIVIVNEHAQIFTDKLCGLADGPEVDLSPLTSLCILDAMFETIMGTNPRSQLGEAKDYVGAIAGLGKTYAQRIKNPLYWNDTVFKFTALGRTWDKYRDIAHRTTEKVIRERKRDLDRCREGDVIVDDMTQEVRKRRRLAFLDLLIEAQRQQGAITDEGIQEEVDTFLFEGHDTTSTALEFAMYALARHPAIQRKVHEELDRVFGNDRDRPVTSEDLQKLEYLSRVMKESQRLFGTAPSVGRDLEIDVEACGTTLPKGTTVMFGLFWLHRDPEQFPEPLKFDPDRFLPEMCDKRHKFAYVPFSAGHRNCIGQKLAVMEQKIIMATLLRKLTLTSSQAMEDLGLVWEFVLRARKSVMVKFHHRPHDE